jgi:hypothetical protein
LKLPIIGILSGVALATLGISSAAQAITLIPPDLNPGDQYRIAFVTSTIRDATSSDIDVYNAFVNDTAKASTSLLKNLNTNWKAIASTSTVNAIDNTSTAGAGGLPIYRVDGLRIANNYPDLWDGTLNTNALAYDEKGIGSDNGCWVWTGTLRNGLSAGNSALGVISNNTVQGCPTSNFFWINYAHWPALDGQMRFYGISGVLTVPIPTTSTPEPSSLLGFITLGGLILGSATRKSRN